MFYGTTLKCPNFLLYLYILVWSLAVSNAGNTLPDFQSHQIADLLTHQDFLEYHLVAVVFTMDQFSFPISHTTWLSLTWTNTDLPQISSICLRFPHNCQRVKTGAKTMQSVPSFSLESKLLCSKLLLTVWYFLTENPWTWRDWQETQWRNKHTQASWKKGTKQREG